MDENLVGDNGSDGASSIAGDGGAALRPVALATTTTTTTTTATTTVRGEVGGGGWVGGMIPEGADVFVRWWW